MTNSKVLKKVQSHKNMKYKRIVIQESSDEEDEEFVVKKKTNYKRIILKESSDEEDDYSTSKSNVKTDKIRNGRKSKDDNEFSQSDCKKSSIIAQVEAINYQNKLKVLCDSDSDDENSQSKNVCKRKLNYNNNTPKFESEHTILRKITKRDKPIDSLFVRQNTTLLLEQSKRFPSLSKDSTRQLFEDSPRIILEDIGSSKIRKAAKSIDFSFKKQDTTFSSDKPPSVKSFPSISKEGSSKIKKTDKPIDSSSLKQNTSLSTENPPTRKSFLASLSEDVPLEKADLKAMDYRVNYASSKEKLCKVLYKLYNEKVFDNNLPKDMEIEWNTRLQKSAGKCYRKKHYNAHGELVKFSSRIGLSSKILDSPDKLRDVLIHEMCHAASWLINKVNDHHGNFWQTWTNKAMSVFPELPVISRCHEYQTEKKYTYRCIGCGYSFGRIRRSLNLNKKCCGKCHGKFVLLINKV